ncbi:hypothetical protein CXQ85_004498 [Candidozyma haemuli]|uniref:Adenylate kinase isoenzyme 6 homolog n=1 Tax=Candidozyma haemuli TaxID=45357 RepID=A0A2V1AT98_9ASCO|nr:hypothetical protein CXQ85_004498 [[Candida] haemuloni]PVH20982.1 hypothetical protein CXQ85_004498 [[Candida] haemuloni]
MTPKPTRFHPNIIITGTPGCGKTSLSKKLAESLPEANYTHYNISELAKDRDCIESYDKERDTGVVDEDKLLDGLEDDLRKGGAIVDWHCCDIFPKRLIDLVVVLRTDNSLLYDRLKARKYSDKKIDENIDCEIMEVILNDANEAYNKEIVISLESNSEEDVKENQGRIEAWVEMWRKDHDEGVTNEVSDEGTGLEEGSEEETSDEEASDEGTGLEEGEDDEEDSEEDSDEGAGLEEQGDDAKEEPVAKKRKTDA